MQGAPRILIVDDSEEDVLLAAAQIRRWARDALIRRVDNPADFSAAIESGSWDLVLCDHHMPTFDSGAALELLNNTGRSVPFFVYSGYFSPTQRENAVREASQRLCRQARYRRVDAHHRPHAQSCAAARRARKTPARLPGRTESQRPSAGETSRPRPGLAGHQD